MKGIHPDVLFAQSRMEMESNPYVRAMGKFREAHASERFRAQDRREALLADPDRYDLTPEEIEAVRGVDQR